MTTKVKCGSNKWCAKCEVFRILKRFGIYPQFDLEKNGACSVFNEIHEEKLD